MPVLRAALEDFEDFSQISGYAANQGWEPVTPAEHPTPSDDPLEVEAYSYEWRTNGNSRARFVDDEVSEAQFVEFNGDRAALDLEAFSRAFSVLDHRKCLQNLTTQVDDSSRARSVELIGLIAPREFDAEVFRTILRELDAESLIVRAAAIGAAAQLSWSEFRAPLERVKETDPNSNNRSYATNVLYSLPPSP